MCANKLLINKFLIPSTDYSRTFKADFNRPERLGETQDNYYFSNIYFSNIYNNITLVIFTMFLKWCPLLCCSGRCEHEALLDYANISREQPRFNR